MFRIDHHVHTTRHSPDSIIEPEELIQRAAEVGLDGVVITEHDRQWDADELDDLRASAGDLLVLSGVEVSAREGHFLVYGLPDLRDIEAGIPLEDLLKVVDGAGAAIVAAHPFRWGQDFDAIMECHGAGLHALELVSNNVTRQTRELTERLRRRHLVGVTGSSDGHALDVVGCYHTVFSHPITDMSAFVAALRAGDFRPGHRVGGPCACGFV